MRILAAALACGLLWSTPSFGQDAGSYVPQSSNLVLRWKNPQASIERAENFMMRVGLVPPGTEKGFLLQQLQAQTPALASMDLSQPVWVAGFGSADDPKPMMVFSLKKGADPKAIASVINGARIVRHGGIVIALDQSLPAELGKKKQKQSYRFASAGVAERSNVTVDLVGEMLQKIMSGSTGAQPELAGLEKAMAQFYEDMKGLTIGANLTGEALMMTMGSVYDKGSTYTQGLAKMRNEEGSVLKGLPKGQYALVGGGSASQLSEQSLPMVQSMIQSMKPAFAANESTAPLASQLDELVRLIGESFGATQKTFFGLEIPGGLETTRVVGYSEGDSAKMKKAMRDLFDWVKTTLAKASEASGQEAPIELVKSDKPSKQAGVAFDSYGFALRGEEAVSIRGEMGPLARLLDQRMQIGAVSKSKSVFVWSSDAAFIQQAVTAAKAPKPFLASSPRFKAASDALPNARIAEYFLDVGPIAAAIMSMRIPAMASTVRSALGTVPPIGYTVSKASGAEIRADVFVPLQLVEAGIGLSQLFQGGT
ncbi:MAG: hypothetical protein AAGD10_18825 [Myxococcota bacterium]